MLWTKDAERFLIENYPSEGKIYCAQALGCSEASIRAKASRLGLKRSVGVGRKTHEQYEHELMVLDVPFFPIGKYELSSKVLEHECFEGHRWFITPNNALRGYGCPHCAGNIRKSQEEYAGQVPDNYEVVGEYINTDTPIAHRHLICGLVWNVRPHDILIGSGCPVCSSNNRDLLLPGYVYHVSFEYQGNTYYKIGVTKKSNISDRFRTDWLKFNMKLLWFKSLPAGMEAYALEAKILKQYKDMLFNTGALISGNTETLTCEIKESEYE